MSWKDKFREAIEGRDDGLFYKLADGINIFRPLPNYYWQMGPEPDENPTAVEYLKHKEVGPKGRMCTCGKSFDAEGNVTGACYLCDTIIPKFMAGSEKERERAEKMKAVPFTLMQVSPVVNGRFRDPKIMELQVGGAKSWGSKVMGILLRADKFYEHPLKGKNFVIHKKVEPGKAAMQGTTYPVIEVEEEVTKVPKAIFDARQKLEDLLPVYDIDEIKAALRGEEYKKKGAAENWDTSGGEGYDETGGAGYEAAAPEAEAPYNDYGYPYDQREANGGYYDSGANWIEYDAAAEAAEAAEAGGGEGDWGEGAPVEGQAEPDGTPGADDWGEATEGTEAAEPDGAGWGADEAQVAQTEEWADPNAASGGADGWGDDPAPAPPAKKAGPPAKKQAPPAPPAPVKSGPPAKKAAPPPPPPPAKKQAAPPPAPPAKKAGGPPPPQKQAAPAGPPAKKQAPPPVKKGGAPPPAKKAGR